MEIQLILVQIEDYFKKAERPMGFIPCFYCEDLQLVWPCDAGVLNTSGNRLEEEFPNFLAHPSSSCVDLEQPDCEVCAEFAKDFKKSKVKYLIYDLEIDDGLEGLQSLTKGK